MKNILAYISEPAPGKGIKLFGIGCLIGLPCFTAWVLLDIQNTIFVSISITLFLIGCIFFIVGGINHWRYFNKHNKEFLNPTRTKQPWER